MEIIARKGFVNQVFLNKRRALSKSKTSRLSNQRALFSLHLRYLISYLRVELRVTDKIEGKRANLILKKAAGKLRDKRPDDTRADRVGKDK